MARRCETQIVFGSALRQWDNFLEGASLWCAKHESRLRLILTTSFIDFPWFNKSSRRCSWGGTILTCRHMGRARRGWALSHCSGTHRHSSRCTRRLGFLALLEASTTSRTSDRPVLAPPGYRLLDSLSLKIQMWLERRESTSTARMLSQTLKREIKEN